MYGTPLSTLGERRIAAGGMYAAATIPFSSQAFGVSAERLLPSRAQRFVPRKSLFPSLRNLSKYNPELIHGIP